MDEESAYDNQRWKEGVSLDIFLESVTFAA